MKRSILIFLLLPSIGLAHTAPKPLQLCRVKWTSPWTGNSGYGIWMSPEDANARAAWMNGYAAKGIKHQVECKDVPKPWYKKMFHK